MLLPTTTNLKELLVRELSFSSRATAYELQRRITKRHRRYTIQGIYKELRNLQKDAVITKTGEQYALSLPWILNTMNLTEQMFETHLRRLPIQSLLPPGKKKARWRFENLIKLQDFWIEIIFILFQHSKAKFMYQWIPHPWFQLLQHEKSRNFFEAMKVGNFEMKTILGGDQYLDKEFARLSHSVDVKYRYSYAPGPFNAQQNSYYEQIDDFLLTVSLDADTGRRIEDLYQGVTERNNVLLRTAARILNEPCRATLTLEQGTPRVRQVNKKFAEYFD
jgi:hypothetical protein